MRSPVLSPTLPIVAIGLGLWLLLSVLILVTLWPWFPRTPMQWLLTLLLGVPIWVGMELLGETLFSPKLARRISARKFSWLRVFYGVFAMVLFVAIALGVAYVVGVAMR